MTALPVTAFATNAGERMPRIVAVGRYRLYRHLQRMVPGVNEGVSIELLERAFAEAADALRTAHAHTPIDAIVAAGASGAYLQRHLDIPVAMVEVRGLDLLQALSQARALAPRIALVTNGEPAKAFAHFNALFGLGIAQFGYSDEQGAHACVAALRKAGVGAVVAPGLVADLAEQAGLASVFLYSDEAVQRALDDAVRLARRAHADRSRSERLGTILGQLQDGVVAVDRHERIEALNPAMARLLGDEVAALQGRVLSAVAPILELAGTLRKREPTGDEVVRLDTRTVVVRRAPIVEHGEITGALLVCRDPETIQRADRRLRATQRAPGASARYRIDSFAGESLLARRVRELALHCAASDATVLVTGESGCGKELVAQGIHNAGVRATQPFLAVNCAALGESLLESELFGYEEGAFTGARRGGKPGLIEAAHTGTLFLDEIGDMPLVLQTRLLRVLQEREVLRLGATVSVPVDVRVIAATHADLSQQMERGHFRRDLYYRLAVLRITVPPLRDRREDLPQLALRLLEFRARQAGVREKDCQPLLNTLLGLSADYPWPGNVRELENMIERLIACRDYLAPHACVESTRFTELFPECLVTQPSGQRKTLLREARLAADLQRVREVLDSVQGDQMQACKKLGISRATLWRRLRAMDEAGK